jgi:hypothetical protein
MLCMCCAISLQMSEALLMLQDIQVEQPEGNQLRIALLEHQMTSQLNTYRQGG